MLAQWGLGWWPIVGLGLGPMGWGGGHRAEAVREAVREMVSNSRAFALHLGRGSGGGGGGGSRRTDPFAKFYPRFSSHPDLPRPYLLGLKAMDKVFGVFGV